VWSWLPFQPVATKLGYRVLVLPEEVYLLSTSRLTRQESLGESLEKETRGGELEEEIPTEK